MTIIKKIIRDNKKAWDGKINFSLWANRITKKSATGKSTFELVYGLDVIFPVHLKLPVYQLLQGFGTDEDAVQNRVNQLLELDKNRRKAIDQSMKILDQQPFRKVIQFYYGINRRKS